MKNFTTKQLLSQHLHAQKVAGATIGFVPTMGALHRGHLSLIARAKQECDLVICSIFVNPTQFNDPKDLEKYPRPIEADIAKLEQAGCDILFNPDVTEMYAGNEQWHLDIGELEHLLEGKSRPGHYQGVTQVVYKLFSIVEPDKAYFGQKDFQQVLVINRMVEMLKMPVQVVMCPIERESDGLAMSSRNVHLTANDRERALILSKTLNQVKNNFSSTDINTLKQLAETAVSIEPGVLLDYFEIADAETLHPANQNTTNIVALVAARVGATRLIDNMIIR
ncbi:pantoate--beta-alanine ligase [Mucilaginibacter defluvii]